MPRKSAKYAVLCIAIRQARAKRRTCRLHADVYVQSCTYRIVQIRSYSFVCTDSCIQTRTYKLVRTSSYIQARTYGFVRTDAYCDIQARTYGFVRTDAHYDKAICMCRPALTFPYRVTYRSARTSASGVVCAGLGPSLFQLRVRVRQGLRDEGTKAMLRQVLIWKTMFDYIAQHLEGQVRARHRRDSAIKRLLLIPFGAFPACAARE